MIGKEKKFMSYGTNKSKCWSFSWRRGNSLILCRGGKVVVSAMRA